ncbi:heavy-metal-associated domain-containing protein [Haloferax mediterranei ATCC 33500]|uniref:Heavy metal transporter n=1 Tax=Haloferax mediterranei (strain ATCC 33500 / DSM 1411 / JCM 8866 / NBRC 14739 / NCIMB 2177 / R-4) TaxID=523841 RepID=I3R5L7_HALMT|nr:cation transporter [Haloferax mediterranei]AFK19527.1 mercuric transport protein [Haloferax mediterranei ATCC 33500]AHZ22923.1 heavy metal transporter [Haloferax mediterranei ATCC 33500]ELZ99848.1 mercuric transport protein [Haloferax mediterranei ATCC 33500]MDX5987731.1 cation transporter [Haloferax mediterranei ATCC 33500]QCQ74210.1 heavy-metal-associated domain-containing protein [Haloferax mediterranei ATCC 33500]
MSTTISVTGMTCEHCEQRVAEALAEVSGVASATADREAEAATVEGDVDSADLVAAVEDAGYEASV